MRAYQFISEVDHKKIGLDIKSTDPRFPLYKAAILKHSMASRAVSNILHKLHRAKNPKKILDTLTPNAVYQIRMLDDIMWNHPLKQQLTVYHGAKESPLSIWLTKRVPLDQPIRVHLPAYTSTSTNLDRASGFANRDWYEKLEPLMQRYAPALLHTKYAMDTKYYNVLKIDLLPGMPALSIKQHSYHSSEDEVLLGRGVEIEIQPNPVINGGRAIWDCKVVYVNPREYWTD